jgi:hypothetical protein
MPNHKYVIRIDGKIVWEGLNVEEVFRKIKRDNPDKRVALAWIPTKEEILVV